MLEQVLASRLFTSSSVLREQATKIHVIFLSAKTLGRDIRIKRCTKNRLRNAEIDTLSIINLEQPIRNRHKHVVSLVTTWCSVADDGADGLSIINQSNQWEIGTSTLSPWQPPDVKMTQSYEHPGKWSNQFVLFCVQVLRRLLMTLWSAWWLVGWHLI